ncbi:MAG: Ig domain-containing protein [Deinococcales bacterium]
MTEQQKWSRSSHVLVLGLILSILTACATPPAPEPGPQAKNQHPTSYGNATLYQPQEVPKGGELSGQVHMELNWGKLANPNAPLALKILIISADEGNSALDAVKQLFKQTGTPYEVMIATQEELTEAKLIASDGSGRYQAIFLAEGSLSYFNGTGYASAFSSEEWNLLWQYERDFKVRQVSMYGFPGSYPEPYGVTFEKAQETTSAPLHSYLTEAGKNIFSSLKATAVIPIRYAYTYLAKLDGSSPPTATPLLQDAAGNVLAVMGVSSDGRERINLMMGHNPYLLHTQLLGYDLLRWATQGVFIGERRMYLNIDIDDWYLSSNVWNPATLSNWPIEEKVFRMTGHDVLATRDQILKLRQRYPQASTLTYVNVFNAMLGEPSAQVDCSDSASLNGASLCVNDFFDWVSHTYTHATMDPLDYATSYYEFNENIKFANQVGLNFSANSLVTGQHSGLGYFFISEGQAQGLTCQYDQVPGDAYCQFGLEHSNANMLKAAKDLGIKYLAANRGWLSHTAECDTCGIVHPLEPSIMLIPRWPTNVFYNVTNPSEALSEFNHFYGPNGIIRDGNGNVFFNHELNYEEYLDFESNMALYHVLTFSPYPHFFHQDNLREYSPGRSLIYDWSEALLAKYDRYFALPILNLKWPDMAALVEEHTGFHESGVSGVWYRDTNQVRLTSPKAATIFATGIGLTGAHWNYGNVKVAKQRLAAGETISAAVVNDTANNRAPVIQAIANQQHSEAMAVSLQVVASDLDGDSLQYFAEGLPLGLAMDSHTGLISGTLPRGSKGIYSISITVSDGIALSGTSFNWVVGVQ